MATTEPQQLEETTPPIGIKGAIEELGAIGRRQRPKKQFKNSQRSEKEQQKLAKSMQRKLTILQQFEFISSKTKPKEATSLDSACFSTSATLFWQ
ncbi:hypothetical protein BB561_006936 [Smittium simulii]|uniref:Uncharacterized protein n=1 Tax=Smittium simulii TaxID=133385 RepID=A0A2T9XZN0_9FUNG|nr:hypothetical protein BB561_006936 [Smittium simulii]